MENVDLIKEEEREEEEYVGKAGCVWLAITAWLIMILFSLLIVIAIALTLPYVYSSVSDFIDFFDSEFGQGTVGNMFVAVVVLCIGAFIATQSTRR